MKENALTVIPTLSWQAMAFLFETAIAAPEYCCFDSWNVMKQFTIGPHHLLDVARPTPYA